METIVNELIESIKQLNNKDFWDYAAIIAPIFLSIVAIVISLWSSMWSEKIKKLEAFMVWDDLFNTHFIIIKNSGKKSLVIKSVSLYAYDKKTKTTYELGTRENAWAIRQEKEYINQGEAIKIAPIYGSIYDVFAYNGHAFDITNEIRNLKVTMKISDLDGKTWCFKTNFTLGEIDDSLEYATTFE